MARPRNRPEHRVIAGMGSEPFSIARIPVQGYVLENLKRVLDLHSTEALFRSTVEGELFAFGRALERRRLLDKETLSFLQYPAKAYLPGRPKAPFEVVATDTIASLTAAGCAALSAGVALEGFEMVAHRCRVLEDSFKATPLATRIDAAVGYPPVDTDDALEQITTEAERREMFIPDEYYQHFFRLKGKPYTPASERAAYIGRETANLIYRRLGPGVYGELRDRVQRGAGNRPKTRLYQHLGDLRPKADDLVDTVIRTMRKSETWDEFLAKLDRVAPDVEDAG